MIVIQMQNWKPISKMEHINHVLSRFLLEILIRIMLWKIGGLIKFTILINTNRNIFCPFSFQKLLHQTRIQFYKEIIQNFNLKEGFVQ